MTSIILDEQDERVVFTGNWDRLSDPVLYHGVATGSKTAGTTCSFNFTGTSVMVVGTIVRGGPFSIQFLLDGEPFTNGTATGFNDFSNGEFSFHDSTFTANNLKDGDHQLVITNTLSTDEINFFLDYFIFTASAKTNMSKASVFLDDRDPSLQYAGNWRFDSADSTFRHTSRAADNTSEASLTIPFTGNSIEYYGLINSGALGDMLLAEFVLDGTSTTTYAPPEQTADITYNNKIYDSGPLTQGSHKLVVTPKNEHLVWIDYVLVGQAETTQSLQPSSLTSTPTSTNPDRLPGPTGDSSATPAPGSTTPVGAIVGGVVGGVVGLLLLLILLLLLRRRRKPSEPEISPDMVTAYPSFIPETQTPYTDHLSPKWPGSPYSMPTTGQSSSFPSHSNHNYTSDAGQSEIPSTSSVAASQRRLYEKASHQARQTGVSTTVTGSPLPHPAPPQPVMHTDSGVRLNGTINSPTLTELPPTYTAD